MTDINIDEKVKAKVERERAYQRAYYRAHKDEIKKKARDRYLVITEPIVKRRYGTAYKSPEDKADVIFEDLPKVKLGRPKKERAEPELPKRPVGRPLKDPSKPRKKKDPNAPKRPVGRPRKNKDADPPPSLDTSQIIKSE